MDVVQSLAPFIGSETPFALLFVALFFYVIKTNKDREQRHHNLVQEELSALSEDLKVLINVWKILLEKELEVKKNGNGKL